MTPDKQTRVHVVGCPRSGTTLMTELLRYAFEFARAAGHERSLFDDIPEDASPYLTKKPADTIRIGRAFEQDENLYLVTVIRDPDDSWTSCLQGVATEGSSYKDAVDKWPGNWEAPGATGLKQTGT